VKRLLLVLCIVGGAVYLFAPRAVPVSDETVLAQAHVETGKRNDGPLRTSWGSTLQSLRQDPDTSARTEEPGTYRHAAAYGDVTGSIDKPSTTATDAPDQEPGRWARVTLAATVYKEPSLSSPVAGYSSPGTEVQILEYRDGWFRVQNPVTQESGWILYNSLEYIHGPTEAPTQIAAVAEPAPKPPANVVSTTSRKPTRTTQPAVSSRDNKAAAQRDFRSAELAPRHQVAETGKRRRGLGLFKRRQARRAYSLGPAH
jgi:Bacterial SH3 domain